MLKSLFALALLAAPAMADNLGPSGGPSIKPFSLITEEYENDYKTAKKCTGHPRQGGDVFEGGKAIYYKPNSGDVQVLQDEYARRFALDYCWI